MCLSFVDWMYYRLLKERQRREEEEAKRLDFSLGDT